MGLPYFSMDYTFRHDVFALVSLTVRRSLPAPLIADLHRIAPPNLGWTGWYLKSLRRNPQRPSSPSSLILAGWSDWEIPDRTSRAPADEHDSRRSLSFAQVIGSLPSASTEDICAKCVETTRQSFVMGLERHRIIARGGRSSIRTKFATWTLSCQYYSTTLSVRRGSTMRDIEWWPPHGPNIPHSSKPF